MKARPRPPGLPLLAPVGALWERVATRRRERYRSGRSRQQRLERPVISIGNITVGGTGKTPMTLLLASTLAEEGCRVSVLSRGYAGRRRVDPMLVDPSEPDAWRRAGDEPVLMARQLPSAIVTVGRRRAEAGRLAERTRAVDVHLLDDGFQHLDLHRDLDIVLVAEGMDPLGARCVPAGPYREPPHALRFADVIVVKESASSASSRHPDERFASLAPGVPLLAGRLVPRSLDAVGSAAGSLPAGWLAGRSVGALAAIGDPASFRATLEELGARVVTFDALPDHAAISEGRLSDMARRARRAGAEALVCTTKDAVRIASAPELPLHALRVELELDDLQRLMTLVRAAMSRPRGIPAA